MANLPLAFSAVLLLSSTPLIFADEPQPAAGAEQTRQATPDMVVEAELPAGFPTPGPANEVTRKSYPAYRAARTDKPDAFRRLFNHIQKHDIAMTAPVEMTMQPGEGHGEQRVASRMMDMMFMYANTDMGELGPDADVQVVDIEPRDVLSYGFFGEMDDAHFSFALSKVEAALATDDTLEAAGLPRVLGYNSPFVPASRRYTEVQLPVRVKAAE